MNFPLDFIVDTEWVSVGVWLEPVGGDGIVVAVAEDDATDNDQADDDDLAWLTGGPDGRALPLPEEELA